MDRRAILLKPLGIWATLLLLGLASLGYALLPGAPAKPLVALAIVSVQATIVLIGFMNLRRASPLVATTALAGLVWLSFLFLMAFADLWTR